MNISESTVEPGIGSTRYVGHSSGRPHFSLCMIARDNEATIGEALKSAAPWFDEMVVVDTGSTDQTPLIAERYGAIVRYFPWCDDFSAARNVSLSHASGAWIFWMDSDDTLPAKSGQQLKELVHGKVPDSVYGFVAQVHCPSSSHRVEPLIEHQTATIVDHIKVIRNRPDIRFEGRIHEQILPSIRRAGGQVEWTDCFVIHSGASSKPDAIRRKLDRDLRLLRIESDERPGHPFVLFNLGMTLLFSGNFDEARTVLQKCIDRSSSSESHLRKAYVLLVDSLENLEQSHEAQRRCWEGLGRFPDDAELSFRLGKLCMESKQWQDAILAFERALKSNDERYFSSFDPGVKGYKSYANLAVCHTSMRDHKMALDCWINCLKQTPVFQDAWIGIIESCRARNDFSALRLLRDDFVEKEATKVFGLVCEGLILNREGKPCEAKDSFLAAMELDGFEFFKCNEFARFLSHEQLWEESLPVIKKLCDLDPTNASPYFNLGLSLFNVHRYHDAAIELETSIRLRPEYPPAKELLGICRAKVQLEESVR